MLSEELKLFVNTALSQRSESGALKFKAAHGGCPKLYDTLSSFSNQTSEGMLPQILGQVMHVVRRNSASAPLPQAGTRTDKPAYPPVVLREIILNVLIHRDYSIHTDSAPITLQMYSDRLVLENPGGCMDG